MNKKGVVCVSLCLPPLLLYAFVAFVEFTPRAQPKPSLLVPQMAMQPTFEDHDITSGERPQDGAAKTPVSQPGYGVGQEPPWGGDEAEGQGMSNLSTDQRHLVAYLRRYGLNAREGLGVRRERTEPLEAWLLESPPLQDAASLPDPRRSKIYVIDRKRHYLVGDWLRVRLDLRDGRGQARSSGGDEIRMWAVSGSPLNASLPLAVRDVNNGSYIGSAKLPFPSSNVTLRVALTYPREFLRMLVRLRHTLHSLRWVTGVFENDNHTKEVTPCLSSPPVPGYDSTCNLTSANKGSPWFCGRPTRPDLHCRHWAWSGNLPFLEPLPFASQLETSMVKGIDSPPYVKLVPNDVVISVRNATQAPRPPCWRLPRAQTWTSPGRRGWVEGGAWHEAACALPPMSPLSLGRCLADTAVLLFGDSNQGLFLSHTVRYLGAQWTARCHGGDYVEPKICEVPMVGASLLYSPHAKPFNAGTHNSRRYYTGALSEALGLLQRQNRTRSIAVVHYYVHNSFYPLAVYRGRVRLARATIEDALARYPGLKVVIRGPHVIYRGKQHHANFGDNFGPWYGRVWREEFRGLWDRVWFLDLWDLSVALENPTSHPPAHIVHEMVRALFGYFCRA